MGEGHRKAHGEEQVRQRRLLSFCSSLFRQGITVGAAGVACQSAIRDPRR